MKRNLSFDFIRCVAIVFVICIHSMALIDGMVNLSIFPRLVKTVLDTFIYSGVPLFIMLSGNLFSLLKEYVVYCYLSFYGVCLYMLFYMYKRGGEILWNGLLFLYINM